MTDQYAPTNINAPRSPRSITADAQLTLDDGLVEIPSGSPSLTLPDATVIPGREIDIKSIPGTGSVIGSGGQTIDGAGSFTFTTALQAITVKSNGTNWLITSNTATGGGASSAEIIDTNGNTSVSTEQPIGVDTDTIVFTNDGTVSGRFTPTNQFEVDWNIDLPIADGDTDQGQYRIAGDRVLHLGHDATDLNFFAGPLSGSPTLTSGAAIENTGIGTRALGSITEGPNNVAVGFDAGFGLEDGGRNVCIGHGSGILLVDGSENTFLGTDAGATISGGSGNVCLGHTAGSSLGAGAVNQLVIENSVGELIAGDFGTGALGFRGSIPTPIATIMGSRGGNAALASLLVALDAMGLVVDGTTP